MIGPALRWPLSAWLDFGNFEHQKESLLALQFGLDPARISGESRLMRIALVLASLMGAAALHAAEPLIVPDSVIFFEDLENLDGVKKEAAEANKAISFLLMEPGST